MSRYDKCYRVIFNSASNDFNNELDYTIATYHLNKNHTKMKWTGNEQWFDIKDDVIYDRREAERELVKKCLENYKKSKNLQTQLDQQKAMWNELKEWFNKHYELNLKAKDKDANVLKYILDKISELEKGEKDE